MKDIGKVFFCLCLVTTFAQSQAGQYCGKHGDQEFFCDKGHCCGDFKCCTYYRYYEMWWFWLIWCIIILLGCSCAYYRRRSHTGPYSHLTSFFFPTPPIRTSTTVTTITTENEPTFKLPSYEEAIAMPQLGPPNDNEGAPPPYVCHVENPLNDETQLNCREQHSIDLVATQNAGTTVMQTGQNPNSSST